jgi:hypothetical protein
MSMVKQTMEELTRRREYMLPEEYLRDLRGRMPWRGEYRYFQSENVVCLEHFRMSHTADQRAGRFGWIPNNVPLDEPTKPAA